MTATSRLASNGIRFGTLGALASVAVAFPLAEGSADDAAHTGAGRIGFYASRVSGSEKLAAVVMGVERLAATATGAEVNGELLVSGVAIIGGPLHVDDDIVVGTGVLPTSATSGFVYVSSCAGTPTGTPASYTGRIPLVYDSSSDTLYAYNGSAWVPVGPSTAVTDYLGTNAEILPLNYKVGDRWTVTPPDGNYVVRVCRADPITHTTNDWFAIGRQN